MSLPSLALGPTLAQWGLFRLVPNGTALIASQVPRTNLYAHRGLSTGVVAGAVGPLIGGLIAENLGMHNVFLLVSFFLFWFPS